MKRLDKLAFCKTFPVFLQKNATFAHQNQSKMVAALDTRKIRLIHIIAALDNSRVLEKVEQLLFTELSAEQKRMLASLVLPIAETTDLQQILKEQHYDGPDKTRFESFVKKLDIHEPVEQLLALLTK